jgi:hypothetical protein
MNLTRSTTLRLIKIAAIALIAIIIISYAIWRSLNYARGPKIDINSPISGAVITSTTTEIIGQVERAHDLYINNGLISIDEQGHFKQIIVIFPGVNRISIKAKDQFDRTTETILEVVGAER